MTNNLSELRPSLKHKRSGFTLTRNDSMNIITHQQQDQFEQQLKQHNMKHDVQHKHKGSQLTRFRGHFILDKSHEHMNGSRDQSVMEVSLKCSDFECAPPVSNIDCVSKAKKNSRYRIRLEYEFDPNVHKPNENGLTAVELMLPSEDGRPSKILAELKPALRSIVDKLVETHHAKAMKHRGNKTERHGTLHSRSKSIDVAQSRIGLNTTTITVPFSQMGRVCESQATVPIDRGSGTASPVEQVLNPEVISGDNVPSPVIAEYKSKEQEQQQLLVQRIPGSFEVSSHPDHANRSSSLVGMGELDFVHPCTIFIPPSPGDHVSDTAKALPICRPQDVETRLMVNTDQKRSTVGEFNRAETTYRSQRASSNYFVPLTIHKEIPWFCLRNTNSVSQRSICCTRRVFTGAVHVPMIRNPWYMFGSSKTVIIIRPFLLEVSTDKYKVSLPFGESHSLTKKTNERFLENAALVSNDLSVPQLRSPTDSQPNQPLLLAANQISESRVVEISTNSLRSSYQSMPGSRSLDRLSHARSYRVPPLVTPSTIQNIILLLNPINYFTDNERAMNSARANLLATSESRRPVNIRWGPPSSSCKRRERVLVKQHKNRTQTNKHAKNVLISTKPYEGIHIIPATRSISLERSADEFNKNESSLPNTVGWNNNSTCRKVQPTVCHSVKKSDCTCWHRRTRIKESCRRYPGRHKRTPFRRCLRSCARGRHSFGRRVPYYHRIISFDNERFLPYNKHYRPESMCCYCQQQFLYDSKCHLGCCCHNTIPLSYESVQLPVVYLDFFPEQCALRKCSCNTQTTNEISEEVPLEEIFKPVLDIPPELPVKVENNSAVTTKHRLDQTVLVDCDLDHDLGERDIEHGSPPLSLGNCGRALLCDASVRTPVCTCNKSISCMYPNDEKLASYEQNITSQSLSELRNLITPELPLLFNSTNLISRRDSPHTDTETIYYPSSSETVQFHTLSKCHGRSSIKSRLWLHQYGGDSSGLVRPVRLLPKKKVRKSKWSIIKPKTTIRSPIGRFQSTSRESSQRSLRSSISSFGEYFPQKSQPTLMPYTSPTRKCLAEEGGFYFFLSSPDSMSTIDSEVADHKFQPPEDSLRFTSQRHEFSAVCPVIVDDRLTNITNDSSKFAAEIRLEGCTPGDNYYYYSNLKEVDNMTTKTGLSKVAENVMHASRQSENEALKYSSQIGFITDDCNCSSISPEKQFVAVSGISTDIHSCEIPIDTQIQANLPSGVPPDKVLLDISRRSVLCKHLKEAGSRKIDGSHLSEIRCQALQSAQSLLKDHNNLSPSFNNGLILDLPEGNPQTSHLKLMHTASQECCETTLSFSEISNDETDKSLPLKTVISRREPARILFHSHTVGNGFVQKKIDIQNRKYPLAQSDETFIPCQIAVNAFDDPEFNVISIEDQRVETSPITNETSESIDYIVLARRQCRTDQTSSFESSTQLSTPTNIQHVSQSSSMSCTSPSFLIGDFSPQISRLKMEVAGVSNKTQNEFISVEHNRSKFELNGIEPQVEQISDKMSPNEIKGSRCILAPQTDLKNYSVQCNLTAMFGAENERCDEATEVLTSVALGDGDSSHDSDIPTEEEPSIELDALCKPHSNFSESVTVCMSTQADLSISSRQDEESAVSSGNLRQHIGQTTLRKSLSNIWQSQRIKSLTPVVNSMKSDTAVTDSTRLVGVSSSLATILCNKHAIKGDGGTRKRCETNIALNSTRTSRTQRNKSRYIRSSRSIASCLNLEKLKYRHQLPLRKRLRYLLMDPSARILAKTTYISNPNITRQIMSMCLPHKSPFSSNSVSRSQFEVFDTNNSNSSLLKSGDLWVSDNMLSLQTATLVVRARCCGEDGVPQLQLSPSTSPSLPQSQFPTLTMNLSKSCETMQINTQVERKIDFSQLTNEQNFRLLTTDTKQMPIGNADTNLSKSTSDCQPNSVSDCYYTVEDATVDPCANDAPDLDESSCSLRLDCPDQTSMDSFCLSMDGANCKSAPCYFWYLNGFGEKRWIPYKNMINLSYVPDEMDNYDVSSQFFTEEQHNPGSLSYSAFQSLNAATDYSEAASIIPSTLNNQIPETDSGFSQINVYQENIDTPSFLLERIKHSDPIQNPEPHPGIKLVTALSVINSNEKANCYDNCEQHSESAGQEQYLMDNLHPSSRIRKESSSSAVNFEQSLKRATQTIDYISPTNVSVLSESVRTLCVKQVHTLVSEISIETESVMLLKYTQELIYSAEFFSMNQVAKPPSVEPPYPYERTWLRRSLILLPSVGAVVPLQSICPECFTNTLTWTENIVEWKLSTFSILSMHALRPVNHTITQHVNDLWWFEKLQKQIPISAQKIETHRVISPVWVQPRYGPQPKQRTGLHFYGKSFPRTMLSGLPYLQAPWQVTDQPWYTKQLMWQSRMDCIPYANLRPLKTSSPIDLSNNLFTHRRSIKINRQGERIRSKSNSVIICTRNKWPTGMQTTGISKLRKHSTSSVCKCCATNSDDFGSSIAVRHIMSPRVVEPTLRSTKPRRKVKHWHVFSTRKRRSYCTISSEPCFIGDTQGLHLRKKHSLSAVPKIVHSDDFFDAIDRLHEKGESRQSKFHSVKGKSTVACQTKSSR